MARRSALWGAAAVLLIAAAPVVAQSTQDLMRKYPATERFQGKPAAVNLASHKDARSFRTRLREGALTGPNFAGHMTVILWGCGTSCQTVALVDARNGRVYFGPTAAAGAKYRVDSRLLVVNAPEDVKEAYGNDPPDWAGKPEYYLWDKGKLTTIKP
jgi:hypothetical protein